MNTTPSTKTASDPTKKSQAYLVTLFDPDDGAAHFSGRTRYEWIHRRGIRTFIRRYGCATRHGRLPRHLVLSLEKLLQLTLELESHSGPDVGEVDGSGIEDDAIPYDAVICSQGARVRGG